ncbi:ATP-dependent helicase (plasmid) [Burkholderia glumae]|uniref:DNA 3'-5' helicase n=2 Tax=Burkholderia glumae TaxID=337 RepID=A0AAP9Y5C0_BURGL|nr:3'-5' exonuclease [Burkholderia glumae]AJY62433.1 hypothetical protein KS03_5763 [Burkholderia glumae LMG 2196 = ATCC 33617]KHJ60820.1 DNA helicase [Burkholderia glumae]MCM2485704.1 ATP-binding domain-containing protein [Burkholderia glumae]MCM2496132.1 ATP-binding domain-containing protein [Burkholderia glumae]MCM2511484.1 ATP-binding domain-containing protein [Burkholderia glumae]
MSSSFQPTAEQELCVATAATGTNLKIKAFAGAGKTSTLQLIAASQHARKGSYLAFNRDIADYARRKFPSNVTSRTVHAAAYAAASSKIRARMQLATEPSHELAARLGLNPVRVRRVVGDPIELTLFELGQMVVEGLGAYCRSADAQPSISHITVDERIDEHDANTLRQWLLPSVQRLWHESADPNGRSAISPDVTLKLWALAKPYIASDFILFDEAQDSDGVMLSVLERQRHAQIIYVGDPYQQIYEWRGAVNAMEKISAPECALTESFRFGTTVAVLASRLLALMGETTPLRGQETIGTELVEDPTIAPPVDAVLCRKNVTAVWQYAVGLELGHRPTIRMSPAEIEAFADAADMLQAGRRAFRPAAFSLFESWEDARAFSRSAIGVDLLPIVELIDQCGTDYLRRVARHAGMNSSGDYVVSTIHRAKGLEYKRVRIANDFNFKFEEGRFLLEDDEMRLLYVAITRAKHLLDVASLRDDLVRLITQRR